MSNTLCWRTGRLLVYFYTLLWFITFLLTWIRNNQLVQLELQKHQRKFFIWSSEAVWQIVLNAFFMLLGQGKVYFTRIHHDKWTFTFFISSFNMLTVLLLSYNTNEQIDEVSCLFIQAWLYFATFPWHQSIFHTNYFQKQKSLSSGILNNPVVFMHVIVLCI